MFLYLIVGLVGISIGVIIGVLASRLTTSLGTLIIDNSDEDKEVYRIEIDNLDNIPSKKKVLLKVINSHK